MSIVTHSVNTNDREMMQRFGEAFQALFTEEACKLARETKFVQRHSPMTGAVFVQGLVFGFGAEPEATYTHLQQMMGLQKVSVSPQAVEQRMTKNAVVFLRKMLQKMMGICVSSEPVAIEVFNRFKGVYLQDGTVIGLPKSLEEDWKGCGGNTDKSGRSGMRAQVRLELSTGRIEGLWLQEAKACERTGEGSLVGNAPPKGSLVIIDQGYVTIDDMNEMEKNARLRLTHADADLRVKDARGVKWNMADFVLSHTGNEIDEQVVIGGTKKLACRVIAFRVTEERAEQRRARVNKNTKTRYKGSRGDARVGKKHRRADKEGNKRHRVGKNRRRLMQWTVLLTNVPSEQLSGHEARILMRTRWQIELMWKLWKQRGQVDIWRSEKDTRILCEIFAKMMGMIVVHWMTIVGCWTDPNRSMVKAAHVVKILAPSFLLALSGALSFQDLFEVNQCMMKHATVNSRRTRLNTAQLLRDPSRWKPLEGLG